jgi:hypothetical protein
MESSISVRNSVDKQRSGRPVAGEDKRKNVVTTYLTDKEYDILKKFTSEVPIGVYMRNLIRRDLKMSINNN